MPIFDLEHNGTPYQIDAPDAQSAVDAFRNMQGIGQPQQSRIDQAFEGVDRTRVLPSDSFAFKSTGEAARSNLPYPDAEGLISGAMQGRAASALFKDAANVGQAGLNIVKQRGDARYADTLNRGILGGVASDAGGIGETVYKLGEGIVEGVTDAVKLPADVLSGRQQLYGLNPETGAQEFDPSLIKRSFNFGGLAAGTGGVRRAKLPSNLAEDAPAAMLPPMMKATPESGALYRDLAARYKDTTVRDGGARVLSDGEAAAVAAAREGVDLPRYLATDNRSLQSIAASVGDLPYLGSNIPAARKKMMQQVEDRVAGISSAKGFESGSTLSIGEEAEKSLAQFIKTRGGLASKFEDRAYKDLDTQALMPLTNTKEVFNVIANESLKAGLKGNESLLDSLRGLMLRPDGMDIKSMSMKISELRGMLKDDKISDAAQGAIKRAKAALEADRLAAVQELGGVEAVNSLKEANRLYAEASKRAEQLTKITGKKNIFDPSEFGTPEAIINNIYKAVTDRGGNSNLLASAKKAMGSETWEKVGGAVLDRMGRDANNEFTPAAFAKAWGNLGARQKEMLFSKEHAASLDNFRTILQRAAEHGRLGNNSGTAKSQFIQGAAVGGGGVAGSVLAFFDPVTAAVMLLSFAATKGGARFLSNPMKLKAAGRLMKVAPAVKTQDQFINLATPIVRQLSQGEGGVAITADDVAAAANNTAPVKMQKHTVTVADGSKIEVNPMVVELDDLITSYSPRYAQDLQPRDRTRAASDLQVNDIATKLDPERLGYSSEADRGAPIIGGDNMVESGNGRVRALERVYKDGGDSAKNYIGYIEQQGFDVSGMKKPVLVRQRLTELTPEERVKFTRGANISSTLQQSASEKAAQESSLINGNMVSYIKDVSDLHSVSNLPFVRAFVQKLPKTEHGTFLDSNNRLSADGARRIENALFHSAYGDSSTLRRAAESLDDNVRSLTGGMRAAAPEWVKLKEAIKSGDTGKEFDVTGDITKAVNLISHLREKGIKPRDHLAQKDAFSEAGLTESIIEILYAGNRAISKQKVAEILQEYARMAREVVGSGGGMSFLDDTISPRDVLNRAAKKILDNDEDAAKKYKEQVTQKGKNSGRKDTNPASSS